MVEKLARQVAPSVAAMPSERFEKTRLDLRLPFHGGRRTQTRLLRWLAMAEAVCTARRAGEQMINEGATSLACRARATRADVYFPEMFGEGKEEDRGP